MRAKELAETQRNLDVSGLMITQHLAALTFRDDARALTRVEIAITLALHLAGLAAVWRYFQQPIWLALPTLALLLAFPALGALRARRMVAVETLAPLFFLYVVLLARVITIWFIRAPLPYQDESTLANARLLVFQIELALIAALAYTALIQISHLAPHASRRRVIIGLTIALGVASLAWFAAETIGHRTRGVTATDPYAYAQMAVDLATRGTLLHGFPIFNEIKDLGIQWYPIEHVGYRLFDNDTGNAATVWPPGGALWLAIAYRIFGEEGLYIATPLAALASLIVFALFAWEYFRARAALERAIIAAIAVALLATSWEQVDRSLVPLVDVQAQLWSVAAIWMACVIAQRPCLAMTRLVFVGILVGFMLGAAYLIRHTQVLLAIPIVIAAWQLPMRERARFLLTAALAAFVVALPDLLYHQQNFGGWLTPESNELKHFALPNLASSAGKIAERFFAGNEFGYLFPFFLYGAYRAWRDDARRFAAIAVWLVVLVGFHLFYEAIRIRDLLPEFPVVVLLTAYGMVAFGRDLRGRTSAVGGLSSAVVIFFALLLTLTRTQFTLLRVVQPPKVTFGYATAAQRASFDQIGALTPADAVIGSTMNDGAIDLYARRATFRPGEWNSAERAIFVDAMLRANRRVFLLDDGAETSDARRDLATRYTLKQIVALDVPLFSIVDGTPGALWEVKAIGQSGD